MAVDWLVEQMRAFIDLHPEFEAGVDRLASHLARADDDDDLLADSSVDEA